MEFKSAPLSSNSVARVCLSICGDFFPEICHGGGWVDVQGFIWSGLSEEIVDRYRKLKAIIITFKSGQIVIIDIVGLKILELNCSYADALSYLRYLLY